MDRRKDGRTDDRRITWMDRGMDGRIEGRINGW